MAINMQTTGKGCLRAKAAADFLGIGLTTFYNRVKTGAIPEGIKQTARCVVWPIETLQLYLKKCAEASR